MTNINKWGDHGPAGAILRQTHYNAPTRDNNGDGLMQSDVSRCIRVAAIRFLHVPWVLLSLTLALIPCAKAEGLAAPTGRVILTVDGAVANTNAGASAQFDLAMLESLPQLTIRTVTPWTEGQTEFTGPRGSELLTAVGARGRTVVATAINDYQVEIPLTDFTDIAMILATRRDGKPMRVRDKGPIWVIYPWSDRPELKTEIYHSRSIWQLKALTIK